MVRSKSEAMQGKDTFSQSSGYIANASGFEVDKWEFYDPADIAKYYTGKPFLLARRLLQISIALGSWVAKRWLDTRLERAEETFKERAADLRATLVELGPAFVKIAQAVSSRPDVVPLEYMEELSLLQDRIAPFSTRLALEIMEAELGVPIDEVFSDISPRPVAAASLGQVYEAKLRANGQAVAVKVQRPGVKAAIALDVFILRILAGLARQTLKLNTDLQGVVDEWATSLFREMDYQSEARNGIRFKSLFGDLPDVVVPRMYPELTSEKVLVMEWIEGQRLSEVSDLKLVEIGVYCSLSQLLDSGFYHADPHPGNLLKTPAGKLAYLDFGMMGEIGVDLRESLISASVHLVNREFELLALDFVKLGLIPANQEMSEISQSLTGVFQGAITKGVRSISFGDLSVDLAKTMYKFRFRLPAYFSLVVRSLTVLEGIALKSNPNYKVLGSSYPWIARKVLTDASPQIRSTLSALLYKDGEFRFDRLESLLSESTRPMFGVELEEKSGGESEEEKRSKLRSVLGFALSDEAQFLREILVKELAKGVDAYNRAAFDALVSAASRSLPFPLPAGFSLLEEEDRVHLENMMKLQKILVSGSEQAAMAGGEGSPALTLEDLLSAVQNSPKLLQRVASLAILTELPASAQQNALSLPLSLAGQLSSRLLARTIRRATLPSS